MSIFSPITDASQRTCLLGDVDCSCMVRGTRSATLQILISDFAQAFGSCCPRLLGGAPGLRWVVWRRPGRNHRIEVIGLRLSGAWRVRGLECTARRPEPGLVDRVAQVCLGPYRRIMDIKRLVGVYRADGGLRGELRYLAGHYLRGQSCSLCEITHGRLRRKPAWDEAVSCLDIPFDLRHLNELDPDLRSFVGDDAAMVVAVTDTGYVTLLTNVELTKMGGDVSSFMALLQDRIRTSDQSAPR